MFLVLESIKTSTRWGRHSLPSVQEALAGLLPAAGRAPLLSVLDAVNLSALLGFTANPPAEQTETTLTTVPPGGVSRTHNTN